MQDVVQAIDAELQALAVQCQALSIETSFVARVQVLDALAFRILERIENVQYVHGYHATLASLSHQAEALWTRLEAVNARLFQRLRECLVVSNSPATTLLDLCDTYVGRAAPAPDWEDMDADYLDIFLNGILGIRYAPEETQALQSGMIGYHPTPARVIFALVEHLQLQATDVFYDLGAGLGRVVLLVGLLTSAHSRGIEFEAAYCTYARQCAAALRLARVTFVHSDARQADYHEGTAFFLYTPFTGRILQDVLARLQAVARARPITLATYGSCTRDVARQPWLQLTAQQTFAHDTLSFFSSSNSATS